MTTTIGIKTEDFVLLATDSKATIGYMIANKDAQKLHKIQDKAWITIAGSVSDAQHLINAIAAEAKAYKFMRGKPMTVKAIGSVMQHMAWNRYFPFAVAHLIAGFDKNGAQLWSFYGDGSFMPELGITGTGSGSPFALGVLETGYKETMTKEQGLKLAKKAIHAAVSRDAASGGCKFQYVIITKDGEEYGEDEIQTQALR